MLSKFLSNMWAPCISARFWVHSEQFRSDGIEEISAATVLGEGHTDLIRLLGANVATVEARRASSSPNAII